MTIISDDDISPLSHEHPQTEKSIPELAISASVASRVNVAFHQNSVPAVGEIELSAAPGVSFGEIRLRVTATPPFLKPKEFVFDSISEGERSGWKS